MKSPPVPLLQEGRGGAGVSPDSPIWGDAVLGHRAQVALEKVPDVKAGSVVPDEEGRGPGRGPLQAGDRPALGAVVPLQERLLACQPVKPDASVAAAGLRRGGGGAVRDTGHCA